jgi:hypothetical protein
MITISYQLILLHMLTSNYVIQDVIVTDSVFREELHINLQLQLPLIQTQVQKSNLTGV